MNLANKLTIFRIILVPFFVAALMIDAIACNFIIALAVFIIASITDALDGYIARSRNQITSFGKFLDPIADKILVMSALVCFAGLGWIKAWVVVMILARDFIVGAIRLAAVESDSKLVIPARMSGKIKTAVTMAAIIAIILMQAVDFNINTQLFSDILMYICAGLTVFSGAQYIYDSRKLLSDIMKGSKS
jgi:CDP-diacylglycerol--glycerol-3-phosphate 3-phosphatidyltransferase